MAKELATVEAGYSGVSVVDGVTERMDAGATPWRGCGQKLPEVATAKEAIEAAHLDWRVTTEPVYVLDADGNPSQVKGKKAIRREDTGEIFNVLSNGWTPLQNTEAFELFDDVVGAGEAIYETALSLHGGKRVVIVAKLPDTIDLGDGDLIEKYIMLSNGHDGHKGLQMLITPMRFVCHNALNVAIGRATNKFTVFHTAKVAENARQAQRALGLADAHFQLMRQGVNRLIEQRMSEDKAIEYFVKVFDIDDTKKVADLTGPTKVTIETLTKLFHEGRGQTSGPAKGTAWGALNAVTEYLDHYRPSGKLDTLGSSDPAVVSNRLESALFASGARTKQHAWDLLLPAGS